MKNKASVIGRSDTDTLRRIQRTQFEKQLAREAAEKRIPIEVYRKQCSPLYACISALDAVRIRRHRASIFGIPECFCLYDPTTRVWLSPEEAERRERIEKW